MRLTSLKLTGFRNLKKINIDFDDNYDAFAFVGANGQGKTNILEAIYISSLSKSFRTRINSDLINFEQDFCSVKTALVIDSEHKDLEFIVTKNPPRKALKINNVIKNSVDFIATLKAVFFSPDDMALISLTPKVRRRYLDILLSQFDSSYLENLILYKDVLKQRNALIKRIRDGLSKEFELDFWDDKMSEYGVKIIKARVDLLDSIKDLTKKYYQDIAQTEDDIDIKYISTAENINSKESLFEYIQMNHNRDIASGSTKIGPHRDDLQFFCNSHDMTFFASRGEWRSLVLALKFTEIDLIKENTGKSPVLLLDDVFSELDEIRQKYLFNAIKNTQTLITTTHKEFLNELQAPVKIFKVEGGKLI